jgi:hypothetical protein|tara:strand:+ start:266 stop:715 length:450 start_codon:yes stop_codon:yes gene_type:complete
MPTEPVPVTDLLTDIEGQWTFSNVSGTSKKPGFIEVNGASEPLRYNLNVNDQIIGRAGNPTLQENPIGNFKFGDRIYYVALEIYTNTSRQRLYDLMREVRRICHARIHSLTNFQRIRFVNFNESTDNQVNLWTGTIQIELVNNSVSLET